MKQLKILLLTSMIILLSACGGGSSSSIDNPTPTPTPPEPETTITGQVIDDTVQGMNYHCSSGTSGVTDSNGNYTCDIGDDAIFSVGNVFIGQLSVQSNFITPYSFFPTNLEAALNLASLLQSIDSDDNPGNGIIVIDASLAALLPANTNFTSPTFRADTESALSIELIPADEAKERLDKSIIDAGGTVPDSSIPVADAGPNQSVYVSSIVILDGAGSYDADGHLLYYAWEIISKPIGSNATLSDTTLVNPTFNADVAGDYVITLVVSDGTISSATDTVKITATDGVAPPVADAGADQQVHTTSTVQLNGGEAGTLDLSRNLLTYSWSFAYKPEGSTATLSSATVASPTFIADVDGIYLVRLIVNNGSLDSEPDTVTVTASTGNLAPVADAGADKNIHTTSTVTLDGSGSSDADGDTLTYRWNFVNKPEGSNASLSSATIVNPSFTADLDGEYIVQVIVNDGALDSIPDTMTVTASTANSAPIANAGADKSAIIGNAVTLDGSGSTDADDDTLTYSWAFVSKPANSTATLSAPTIVNPSFTADIDGSYVVQLIVNDGTVDSAADTVTITVVSYLTTHVSNTVELRQALLDTAQNGFDDTIILADGVYKTTDDGRGTFNYDSTEAHELKIVGSDSSLAILDGNDVNQVLQHYSTESTKLILENLSIINGKSSTYGGGVYTFETIEVMDCNISDNRAEGNLGGGIMARGYNNKISNSIISHNYAEDGSGGIHFPKNGEIRNSQIIYNVSPPTVEGGVGVTTGLELKIYDSNISYNIGATSGAAVKVYNYNLLIDGSTISYNESGGTGAVISARSKTITNTLIFNNIPTYSP